MTVSASYTPEAYVYEGPGDYTFDFYIPRTADVLAIHIDEEGVSTEMANYSVVKNSATDGGVLTATEPTAAGGVIQIHRVVPYTNPVSWTHEGGLDYEQLESNFDLLVYQIQQLLDVVESGNLSTTWKGDWVELTPYEVKEVIRASTGNLYIAEVNHTSTASFLDDLAVGYWSLLLDVVSVQVYSDAALAAAANAAASEQVCTEAQNSVTLSKNMIDQSEALVARDVASIRDCATAAFEYATNAETSAELAASIVSSGQRVDAMITDYEVLEVGQTVVALTSSGPEENLLVFKDGLKLRLDSDYTTDSAVAATQITLDLAGIGGDKVEVISINTSVLGA